MCRVPSENILFSDPEISAHYTDRDLVRITSGNPLFDTDSGADNSPRPTRNQAPPLTNAALAEFSDLLDTSSSLAHASSTLNPMFESAAEISDADFESPTAYDGGEFTENPLAGGRAVRRSAAVDVPGARSSRRGGDGDGEITENPLGGRSLPRGGDGSGSGAGDAIVNPLVVAKTAPSAAAAVVAAAAGRQLRGPGRSASARTHAELATALKGQEEADPMLVVAAEEVAR